MWGDVDVLRAPARSPVHRPVRTASPLQRPRGRPPSGGLQKSPGAATAKGARI